MGRQSSAKASVAVTRENRFTGVRVQVDVDRRLVARLRRDERFARVFARVLGQRAVNELQTRDLASVRFVAGDERKRRWWHRLLPWRWSRRASTPPTG